MLFNEFKPTVNDLFGADDFWRVMTSDKVTCTTTAELYGDFSDRTRMRLKRLCPVVVLTSADNDVTDERLQRYPAVKRWFAIDNFSSIATTIPYGLYLSNYQIYGDKAPIMAVLSAPKPTVLKLAYMNFSICTRPIERQAVYDKFAPLAWVTTGAHHCSVASRAQFLNSIYSHKFCICPRGNGLDTVRMWESLFLGTIPIVIKSPALAAFYDLPILFIDNWEEVTPPFLEAAYERITTARWNMAKLTLQYWKDLVQDAADAIAAEPAYIPAPPATLAEEMWRHVWSSLEDAIVNTSKLPTAILALEGYLGRQTRHFYNNVCSAPWANAYLEVGVGSGAAFAAALYGNAHCQGTAVDKWSGNRDAFNATVTEFVTSPYTCVDIGTELPDTPKFTVYLFDGEHTYDDQYRAITHIWKHLADTAVILMDDWNWADVRNGTKDGLKAVGALIENLHEIRYTHENEHTPWDVAKAGFWNGIGIFVVSKPK